MTDPDPRDEVEQWNRDNDVGVEVLVRQRYTTTESKAFVLGGKAAIWVRIHDHPVRLDRVTRYARYGSK